jgi:hypothetical protein
MARYYFHIKRGQATILDHWGRELSDLVETYREAARRAHLIERQGAQDHSSCIDGAIVVDDEFSTLLEVAIPTSRKNGVASFE